jgi:hypothetical protein
VNVLCITNLAISSLDISVIVVIINLVSRI